MPQSAFANNVRNKSSLRDNISKLSGEVLLCRCRGGEKCHADVLLKLHDERDVLSLRATLSLKVALPMPKNSWKPPGVVRKQRWMTVTPVPTKVRRCSVQAGNGEELPLQVEHRHLVTPSVLCRVFDWPGALDYRV